MDYTVCFWQGHLNKKKTSLCTKIFTVNLLVKIQFELCWIEPKHNELRTALNSLEARFVNQNRTSNPFKPLKKAQTSNCSVRNGPNPGHYPVKPNFEPFRTQVSSAKAEHRTHERTGFDPTLNKREVNKYFYDKRNRTFTCLAHHKSQWTISKWLELPVPWLVCTF